MASRDLVHHGFAVDDSLVRTESARRTGRLDGIRGDDAGGVGGRSACGPTLPKQSSFSNGCPAARGSVRWTFCGSPSPCPRLPSPWLVQLSDIHLGSFSSQTQLRRLVDQAELARLRPMAGIYGCLGNHEFLVTCDFCDRNRQRSASARASGTSLVTTTNVWPAPIWRAQRVWCDNHFLPNAPTYFP